MARDKRLIPVRFIMKNAPYNVGEIAGFPEAIAQRFVDRKRAVFYKPPEPEVEPKPKASKPKEKPVEETTSEMVVPEKLSGPFYMVAGEKVRGKAKAQARADELNEAAPKE
jgi:hypothetical protein